MKINFELAAFIKVAIFLLNLNRYLFPLAFKYFNKKILLNLISRSLANKIAFDK